MAREKMISDVDAFVEELKRMADFGGDGAFRDKAIELFAFYKSTLETEYKLMIEIVAKKDLKEEDRKKLDEYAHDLIAREKEIDDAFESAQLEFVKKHGLHFKVR